MRNSFHKSKIYDIENFNRYANRFYIKVDETAIEHNIRINENRIDSILFHYKNYILYIERNLRYFTFKNPYSIVYGHFHNNQNVFLYQKVLNKKPIKEVYSLDRKSLYVNPINEIVESASYQRIEQIVKTLNMKARPEDKSVDISKIEYTYENNTIGFHHHVGSEFDSETNVLKLR